MFYSFIANLLISAEAEEWYNCGHSPSIIIVAMIKMKCLRFRVHRSPTDRAVSLL